MQREDRGRMQIRCWMDLTLNRICSKDSSFQVIHLQLFCSIRFLPVEICSSHLCPALSQNPPPLSAASGIDNLALLLENDSYQPACFSIYRFKSVLDQKTIHDFFHALMQAYPRFSYLVELDPSLASKHNKEAMASTVDPSEREAESLQTEKQKKEYEERKKGRKTKYSKSLKAGGWFTPAKFRHDPRFSIDNQIKEVDCLGNGSEDDLNELVSSFKSE